MSAANPELNNINRPSYEMPRLLQSLGNISMSNALTPKQRELSEAIRVHAHNQKETIASGIDSIGQLIYLAGSSNEVVDPHHMRNLGLLLSHLAIQLEHLIDTDRDMEFNLGYVPEATGGIN